MASDRVGITEMSEQTLLYIFGFYLIPLFAFAFGWRMGGRRFLRTQVYVLLSYLLILHGVQFLMGGFGPRPIVGIIIMAVFVCWFGAHGEFLQKEQAKQRGDPDRDESPTGKQ
jgi:hypothetical protein